MDDVKLLHELVNSEKPKWMRRKSINDYEYDYYEECEDPILVEKHLKEVEENLIASWEVVKERKMNAWFNRIYPNGV